jgi:hypothetical protein
MKEKLKKFFGSVVLIIGFLASVTGIMSWLGVSLHLGNIIIPNPIAIILAVIITCILILGAFYLGGAYVLYILMSLLMHVLLKVVNFKGTIHLVPPNTQEQTIQVKPKDSPNAS